MHRRFFLKSLSALAFNTIINRNIMANNYSNLIMPAEDAIHKRTFMAYVANDYIWSHKQIKRVKEDLLLIAKTISKYEQVVMLVNTYDFEQLNTLLKKHTSKYPIIAVQTPLDDLWLRDIAPLFVANDDRKQYAINFNFNGWGNKQQHSKDKNIAKFIANYTNTPLLNSNLVMEGGGIEVDGFGTAIATKSCILNNNRNPNLTLKQIEQKLEKYLGIKKVIWLNGIASADITDGHIDFYARFTHKGQVVVSRDNYKPSFDYAITRENIEVLKQATDVFGNKLNIKIIDTPNKINTHYGIKDFAAGYVGFYICNNAVIMQSFGDEVADATAKKTMQNIYPNKIIEQINIDGIASGGGSIHCATNWQPI